MEIINITLNAFDRYFSILRKRGYVDNSITKILFVLSFINTIFNSELLYFITDDDFNEFYKAIRCLSDKDCCLIDIPQKFGDELYRKVKTNISYRITEDNISCITEENYNKII